MKPPRVLWVGPYVPDAYLRQYRSTSPAACFWQQGLLQALVNIGVDVKLFSRPVIQSWPRGPLRVRTDGLPGMEGVETHYFPHLNVKGPRERSVARDMLRRLRELQAHGWSPDAVITYNTLREHLELGSTVQQSLGIPWICCAADLAVENDSNERPDADFDRAFGAIYLSHKYWRVSTHTHKLHLDGGVDRWRGDPDRPYTKGSILCSGHLGKWGGGKNLLRAFEMLEVEQKALWLTGSESAGLAQKACDSRVAGFGLLSQRELDDLASKADVLVNAKPVGVADNAGSFPSKLLYYLSFGKPIVSTMAEGMDPEYRGLVIAVDDDDPSTMSNALDRALGMTDDGRRALYERIQTFVTERKTWTQCARALALWVSRALSSELVVPIGPHP